MIIFVHTVWNMIVDPPVLGREHLHCTSGLVTMLNKALDWTLTTENGDVTVQNGGLLWLIYGGVKWLIYVTIWLMMVNNKLIGGAISIWKKMMEFVNGKDDNPYIMENKSHVPNHQPVLISHQESL